MENIAMVRDSDREKFEKKICKIPNEKIIGVPKFSVSSNGVMTYMALVNMSKEEIANL
ncbi:hypothetical protein [Cetobacterium sp.]|uniref:hypothetical protein n=1 Tax=Cetobacterium sp. TaxID=2071632 RepID=UPI003F36882B